MAITWGTPATLKLQSVTCARCGAKIREDRVRCLRCKNALVTDVAARRRHSTRLTRILTVGGSLAIVGLTGIIAMRPAPPPAPSVAAATMPTAARVARPVTQPVPRAVVPVTAIDSTRPAEAAYLRGDIAGSIDHFRRAVESDPGNAEALNNLGQVLVRDGRAAQAIAYFDRAIDLAPDKWSYRFNRARAFGELKQWGQAIAGYRQALKLFPEDYATQFNLARVLQANGDLDAAIAAFEQAIALAPAEPDFQLSHAFALESAGRPTEAIAAYKRFLELAPGALQTDKIKGRIAELDRQSRRDALGKTPVRAP